METHILTIVNNFAGIAALLTALVALFLVRSQMRKNNAESAKEEASASQVITDAATSLVEPLRKEMELLRQERAEDAKKIESLQAEITKVQQENDTLRQRQVILEKMNVQLVQAIILNIHARRQIGGLSCASSCLELDSELEKLISDTNHFRSEIGMQPVAYIKPKRKRKDPTDGI